MVFRHVPPPIRAPHAGGRRITMAEKTLYVAQKGNAVKWEVPQRELQPHEVRVKTVSAGINPIDWKTIDNNLADGAGQGNDFAGVVVEVGSDVKHTKVGDTVAGGVGGGNVDDTEQGAFSTEIKLAEDLLFKFPAPLAAAGKDEIPAGLPTTFEQAASLGIAAVTTALAFEGHAQPAPGDYAVIYGATSSLGYYATQYARNIGYKVIAVSAPNKILADLGVETVDRHGDWVAEVKKIAGDSVTYAFDAIALNDSQHVVAKVLSASKPAVLAISDPATKAAPPSNVTVINPLYFFAYQPVKKLGTAAIPDPTKTLERASGLIAEINHQFAKSEIRALPIKVLHGLETVNEGLSLNRKGVSGTKIVIDLE